jgi:hypothetical protein
MCALADLGVVAQVAPALLRLATEAGPKGDWAQAEAKGGGVLVLPGMEALHSLTGATGGTKRRT